MTRSRKTVQMAEIALMSAVLCVISPFTIPVPASPVPLSLALFAVYLAAVGGAGALLSKAILKSEVIAYEDLGTEAIRRLEVKDFPAIVVIDSEGNDLYETAIEEYKE